jgi:sarcosine oxidase
MKNVQIADVAVIGLGAWGASAAWRLAVSGASVIGVDRYQPPHSFGSHTGTTRLARWSTSQDVMYAPLTKSAFELWDELEKSTKTRIVETTGSLLFGPADHPARDVPIQTLKSLGMPYEILDPKQLHSRFPSVWCPDNEIVLYEPNGARLRSAEGISALHKAASNHGAHLYFNERVLNWSATESGVTVNTEKRTISASSLIITAGSWAADFIPTLRKHAVPERQVLVFFKPQKPDMQIPCLYWWQLHESLPHRGYGAFETDGRFKVAFHHGGETDRADDINRRTTDSDINPIVEAVKRRIPGLIPEAVDARVCLYTNTDAVNHIDDEHWVVDRHPAHANVAFATSCNGRGFRYAPAVGDLLAKIVRNDYADLPTQLRMSRLKSLI